jgi:hypothetical protein
MPARREDLPALRNFNLAMVFRREQTIFKHMKSGTFYLITALLAGFSLGAHGEVKDNPYQVIIDRNPFNLKPIPPPPEPVAATPTNTPPQVDIKLTGITTLLGPPRAFLQLMNQQTKKPEFPPGLEVGDRFGDIEILAINTGEETVRIKQGDGETTLDFKNHGIKSAVAGGPAPAPGGPGLMPPPPAHAFPGAPGVTGAPTQNGSRAIVAGNSAGSVPTPGMGAMPNMAGGMPVRPLRADYGNNFGNNVIVSGAGQPATQTPQPTAVPTLSREDAEARIEAQRRMLEQREQSGAAAPGMSRILPPTRFSPPSPAPSVPRPGQ